MKYFDDINSHKYIFLGHIGEPKDNSLRLIIEQASPENEARSIASENITAREISVSKNSNIYEVVFDSYIGYSVIDESYALPNNDDVFEGRLFCIYEKSSYLDYLKKTSFACNDHPGPFKHYGFNCLNHIVDIASAEEPRIKLIGEKI